MSSKDGNSPSPSLSGSEIDIVSNNGQIDELLSALVAKESNESQSDLDAEESDAL